jgi:hypothetical protein
MLGVALQQTAAAALGACAGVRADHLIGLRPAEATMLGDGRRVPIEARLEVAIEDGGSPVRQLVPDASTYGWSFAQVSDFCRDLRGEMPVGGADVEVLIDACSRLETLPDVSALIQATIPRPLESPHGC